MARHATWTSSATHAVLPLLATDAGVRLQLATGIAAHRARSGGWGGGFWLPECAHAPWLDPLLEEAGVRLTCVDLTDVAPGARGPLRPPAGPLLVPLDRPALELVWSRDGYPSHGAYRDTHRLTEHRHQAWAVDGAAYDPARAAARARADAADFVARVLALGRFCCVAWDTELLGLHWHEGVRFLAAVLEAAEAAGLRIAPLDELVAEAEAEPAAIDRATSWGAPRTLDTWSAPRAGGLAWRQRACRAAHAARRGARARCASCSPSSPRTGPSSSPTAPPALTRWSARRGTRPRSAPHSPGRPRCRTTARPGAAPGGRLAAGKVMDRTRPIRGIGRTCRTVGGEVVSFPPQCNQPSPRRHAAGNGGPTRGMTAPGANRRQSAA